MEQKVGLILSRLLPQFNVLDWNARSIRIQNIYFFNKCNVYDHFLQKICEYITYGILKASNIFDWTQFIVY